MDVISIFITGLFAGGLTCLAVQGGLLASSVANIDVSGTNEEKVSHIRPVFWFLLLRLCAYTLLGLLLGLLGTVAQLSIGTRVILQIAVAIFMIGTALNLLNVHPIFRYFVIQPPKFLARIVRNQSKSKSIFGPAILGALTVFIPCGATQAMMAYAIASGSPLSGAITMFIFILGTSPLFFLLGYAFRRFGESARSNVTRFAALAILFIALYNIDGAIALSGSRYTFSNILTDIHCVVSFCSDPRTEAQAGTITSDATIFFTRTGYRSSPERITAKAGTALTIRLSNRDGGGCIQAFTIPKLGIQRLVKVGSTDIINLF